MNSKIYTVDGHTKVWVDTETPIMWGVLSSDGVLRLGCSITMDSYPIDDLLRLLEKAKECDFSNHLPLLKAYTDRLQEFPIEASFEIVNSNLQIKKLRIKGLTSIIDYLKKNPNTKLTVRLRK